jgi:hypothetical protein
MIIISSLCLAVNDYHHYRLINAGAVNELANECAVFVFRYNLVAIINKQGAACREEGVVCFGDPPAEIIINILRRPPQAERRKAIQPRKKPPLLLRKKQRGLGCFARNDVISANQIEVCA